MSFRNRDGSSGPEPSTTSEWAEAVTYSYAILVLARASRLGLVEGPRVNTGRCYDLLRRGRKEGYLPKAEEVTATLVGLLGQEGGVDGVLLAQKLAQQVKINY
jgi:hypothetical protein